MEKFTYRTFLFFKSSLNGPKITPFINILLYTFSLYHSISCKLLQSINKIVKIRLVYSTMAFIIVVLKLNEKLRY
jgi:hypothetical protein